MLIGWFTDPGGESLSSYYQYETSTKKFVRIRLELGRESSRGNIDDTIVVYKPQRYVGFSDQNFPTGKAALKDWTAPEGVVSYKGKALSAEPEDGLGVYDFSRPGGSIHHGNPVTIDPQLPPGIKIEHLQLLANDALTSGGDAEQTTSLTGNGVTEAQLASAIKGEVCRVLGEPDFGKITNDMIITKLKSQVKIIEGGAADESSSDLEKELATGEEAVERIGEQLTDGSITPTEPFEEAVGALESALSEAITTSGEADLPQALIEIEKAQHAEQEALATIDATTSEVAAEQLNTTADALSQAQQRASDLSAIETQSERLADAETFSDYESELDMGEVSEEAS